MDTDNSKLQDDKPPLTGEDVVAEPIVAEPIVTEAIVTFPPSPVLIIRKTWRSEFQGLLAFAILIAGGVALSLYAPGSIVTGPLVSFGESTIFLSLPLFWLLPACWLSVLAFRVYNVRYSANERGLEAVQGILSLNQTIIRLRYEDVRSLEIDQTILERILNTGELEVGTAATAGVELIFDGVADPFALKAYIQRRQEAREDGESRLPGRDNVQQNTQKLAAGEVSEAENEPRAEFAEAKDNIENVSHSERS